LSRTPPRVDPQNIANVTCFRLEGGGTVWRKIEGEGHEYYVRIVVVGRRSVERPAGCGSRAFPAPVFYAPGKSRVTVAMATTPAYKGFSRSAMNIPYSSLFSTNSGTCICKTPDTFLLYF